MNLLVLVSSFDDHAATKANRSPFSFLTPPPPTPCSPPPLVFQAYGIVLPFTPMGPRGDPRLPTRGAAASILLPPSSSPLLTVPPLASPRVPAVDAGGEGRDGPPAKVPGEAAAGPGVADRGKRGGGGGEGEGAAAVNILTEDGAMRATAAAAGKSGRKTPRPLPLPLPPPPPPPPHASYLCSQLVGAALSEMGVVRVKGGAGGLWVLPGAFGQGGAVERGLSAGVSLGEEVSEEEGSLVFVRLLCCLRFALWAEIDAGLEQGKR